MEIEKLLGMLRADVNRELQVFFEKKIDAIKNENKPKEILEMVELLEKFVTRAGKRIRPILMCEGYFAAGGKNRAEIVKAAVSIELLHSYLLIHDDIIDRDSFRHGDASMHRKYNELYRNAIFSVGERKQFGISMAIIAGDLAASFGYEVLMESDFPLELKLKAVSKMNSIVEDTIIGEAMDVALAYKKNYSVNDVIEMQTFKTAKYTVEGPLHLGAILAGAEKDFLTSMSSYAIPLGVSYQIQDDVIGIFGNEKMIGKPVGSDLKEGKKTLLTIKAFEKGKEDQNLFLNSILGKEDINIGEIEKAREIIKTTGSLEYSKSEIQRLKEKSLENLEIMKIDDEHKNFFKSFADFIVKREN